MARFGKAAKAKEDVGSDSPSSPPQSDDVRERLDELQHLLQEVVEDNTALVARLDEFGRAQTEHAADTLREIGALRDDVDSVLAFRALRELCTELIEPLGAIDAMLASADFSDPETTEGHVRSLSVTLSDVLSRMGAKKVSIDVGVELFDPARHRCIKMVEPVDSPYPTALPRTVVRVVQDGYLLHDRPLTTASVEIQGESHAAAQGEESA